VGLIYLGAWISQQYSDWGWGWATRVQFPAGHESCLRHDVQTGSETRSAFYAVDIGALLSGVKRPGRGAERSAPSRTEVKNTVSPPPCSSAWRGRSTLLHLLVFAYHRLFAVGKDFNEGTELN
jgi:hypothetical protein